GGRGDFPDFLRTLQPKLNLRQSSSQRGTRRFKLVTCLRFPERNVELAEDVVAEALVVEGRRLARVITGPQIVGADGFVQLSGPIQVIAAGNPKAFVGAHAIAKFVGFSCGFKRKRALADIAVARSQAAVGNGEIRVDLDSPLQVRQRSQVALAVGDFSTNAVRLKSFQGRSCNFVYRSGEFLNGCQRLA